MSQISTNELKVMIANEIKTIGLNDVLDETSIEKIKNQIMSFYNREKAKSSLPSMIPEATVPVGMGAVEQGKFPNGEYGTPASTGVTSVAQATSVEAPMNNGDFTQQPGQNIDMGTSGNIPAYTPELPAFLNKVEPAKVIIFSQNELSESGENLSNKPLRTFEDPDIKKSINDMWMDKGQRKAEVYMAKLEKIGDLEFDYANGTTKFIEKRFDPDFEMQAKYKENPYMPKGPAAPGKLDISGQPNLVNQIANAVDMEKAVKDIVMDILRDKFLTNSERAVNEISPEEPMGYSVAQAVSPMEESFSVKMIDLVNSYEKIDAPAELKEAIIKNNKNFLINENQEVQEWLVDGKTYFTPVNKISTKKCYVK